MPSKGGRELYWEMEGHKIICVLDCFPKIKQSNLSCTYCTTGYRIGGATIFKLLVSPFHKYTIKLWEVYLFPVYEKEIANNLLFLSDHWLKFCSSVKKYIVGKKVLMENSKTNLSDFKEWTACRRQACTNHMFLLHKRSYKLLSRWISFFENKIKLLKNKTNINKIIYSVMLFVK